MIPTLRQFPRPRIGLAACALLAWSSASVATAEPLPTFERFPADAPLRLARAVEARVHEFAGGLGVSIGGLGDGELAAIAAGQLDRPVLRRSLWQSIEGALGSFGASGSASGAAGATSPATLIGALDGAIGAYMTELGRIALEIDQRGERDAVTRLAPLHPGEQGSGRIAVGTLGAFRELQVDFRGQIAHPDGSTPAVVARFYLLPDGAHRPIPGRLVIPTAGAEPSFRAEVATTAGARETRDYGWRPRLARLGSILELNIDGRWARVEDELDAMPQQRRPGRDVKGFCDASCAEK